MGESLLDLAMKFLQEAVYASRGVQHAGHAAPGGGAGCGLGERPGVPEAFSEGQARLFEALLQGIPDAARADFVRHAQRLCGEWIRAQDGLDRKRNHFLKAFRQEHGFDRRAYPPEIEAEFAAGLDAINRDNRGRLEDHARLLADLVIEARPTP